MKPKTKKHVEKVEIQVNGKIVIKSRDFVLEYEPSTGLRYRGNMKKVNRAIELFHLAKQEAGLNMYKLGDAIHIEGNQEVEPEDQPIS